MKNSKNTNWLKYFVPTLLLFVMLSATSVVKTSILTSPNTSGFTLNSNTHSLINPKIEKSSDELLADNSKDKKSKPPTKNDFSISNIELSKENIKFITSNIKYPDEARTNNIQGTVLLDIEINSKGDVVSAKVSKGIGFGCDEEAKRVALLLKGIKIKKAIKENEKYFEKLPIKFSMP